MNDTKITKSINRMYSYSNPKRIGYYTFTRDKDRSKIIQHIENQENEINKYKQALREISKLRHIDGNNSKTKMGNIADKVLEGLKK